MTVKVKGKVLDISMGCIHGISNWSSKGKSQFAMIALLTLANYRSIVYNTMERIVTVVGSYSIVTER
jgi:hypothetical protein